MAESMEDILSDVEPKKEEVAPETEKAEAPEKDKAEEFESRKTRWRDKEQEAQGRARDPDTGQYATKEAPKEEPKVEVKPEPKVEVKAVEELTVKEKAAFAKAADETRKRQNLERQLAELQAKTPKEPDKTFWDDPEAALARQKQEIQQAIVGTRLQTSESIARSRHTDFDEKVAIFTELAQTVPGLGQQMMASPDPGEFVYRTAANHKSLQEAGGIDEMRKKIEAEVTAKVRAEIKAELDAKAEKLAKERAALPGSLSDAHSKGTNKAVWNGPPSMDQILHGE